MVISFIQEINLALKIMEEINSSVDPEDIGIEKSLFWSGLTSSCKTFSEFVCSALDNNWK